ncbi:MAG: efflux RND transporter permease subunit [Archangium sp.]|nr:efflux RND transporter permease subunit [Archangium sp.]MDP3151544.1 efflux RND transporter permease subunit [Archangium sp.]MDP3572131.1 efflux RND transporter permease subunit [Archangium sp.]
MTLSDLSIKRPVFTTMMSLLLIVLGLLGVSRLGTDLFPDVSFPFVAITTVYRGAGPAEIEAQVNKPLEDAVAGIQGVDTIQSFSRENVGLVFVQFKLSVPLDRAVQEVRDKVAGVQNLPRDVTAPKVSRIDIGAAPILTYAVNADMESSELRQLIKDKIEPALSQIEGVAQVRTIGGDQREIRIDVDLDKAKSAGVAPAQVAERVGMENVDVPAGRFDLGPTELTVRSLGQFKTVDDIAMLPIARNTQQGTQVLLNEIATVTDGVADRRTIARLNGKEAVIMEIVKQPGSNTVEVARIVKERIIELTPQMGHGFGTSVLIDSSILIEENAKEVWIALIFGGFMAVLIILIFLLDLRGTIISSLALPTSVIGTFFVMFALGYTLNQMTMLALSLAIGLLIDDAVVVREAITHRLEQGESPASAASNGTKDVFLAVLATTLSLVAVFIPVAFMPGIVGMFFKQFGLTISAAVIISMFISFTLDPMLSARFSKALGPDGHSKENAVARNLRKLFEATERFYGRLLGWTLINRWKTALITLVIIVGSLGAASTLGNDFMVPQDRATMIVQLKLPEGSSVSESQTRALQAEEMLRTLPDIIDIYAIIGADPNGMGGDANMVRFRVMTKPRAARAMSLVELKQAARELLSALPATEIAIIDPPDIEGLGDFFPIMIYVMGPEFDGLTNEANRISDVMKSLKTKAGLPMVGDIRVVTNPPKPELAIDIDRARASDTGLSAAALGMQLRMAMNGQVAGKLRQGSEETEIVVRLQEKDRASPESLAALEVFTPSGPRAIGDVASLSIKETPSVIEHFNRERRVMVLASPSANASLGEVANALKAHLEAEPPPEGYSLFYDGQMKVLAEQNSAFLLVIVLAFAFVYMVLASQFESFKHPFTIMVSVPLALVGALLALVVTGWSITLGAMIGLILLMGLVTKNAILLVDQMLQNLREGQELDAAILSAGPRRLRPILMTSAAMAIGMVPTALGRGQGFEFRAPMAIAVIGGVLTSTFLTLFVVPLVFAVFEKLTPKRLRIQKDAVVEPGPETTEVVTP